MITGIIIGVLFGWASAFTAIIWANLYANDEDGGLRYANHKRLPPGSGGD